MRSGQSGGRREPAARRRARGVRWGLLLLLACPAAGARGGAGAWEPVGPSLHDFVGVVTDPADASQVVAIANDLMNGLDVYRSADSGTSWAMVGHIPSGVSVLDYKCFAAAGLARLYVVTGGQCYRSTDGGETWAGSSFGTLTQTATAVCVDPTNPSKVYAAGGEIDFGAGGMHLGFYRSTDGGQSWSTSSHLSFDGVSVHGMAVAKTNPNVIYVCGAKDAGGASYGLLLKSTDGGATWADISSACDPEVYGEFNDVAVDPTDASRVYVAGWDFYRSTDGGATWAPASSYFGAKAMAVDPTDPAKIYVAGWDDVFVSTTYGLAWLELEDAIAGRAAHVEVAPGTPSSIYIATESGLFKSSNAGLAWGAVHRGVRHETIPAVALAASSTSTLVVESQLWGVYKTEDSAGTWERAGDFTGQGDVAALLIHPTVPAVVLALEGSGPGSADLHVSTNQALTWMLMDSSFADGHCIAQDPSRPDISYLGGSRSDGATDRMTVCRSSYAGYNWWTQWRNLGAGPGVCRGAAVAPSDYQVVYAVGEGSGSGKVFRSPDAGDTWADVTSNLAAARVHAALVLPTSPGHVLVGTPGGVFRTTDGGAAWAQTSLALATRALARDPVTGLVFAATESSGVFASQDGGNAWSAMNTGLQDLDGLCLAVDRINRYLYLGTDGGGLWRAPVEGEFVPALSINDVSKPEGHAGTTTFTFTVTLSGPCTSTVTVNYATADATATSGGNDYQAASGTLTFTTTGTLTRTIQVLVNGDTLFEPNETFLVQLSNPANAVIADDEGTGTIENDDSLAQACVDDSNATGEEYGTARYPFDTIQEAVAAVSDGGTVRVARGTYAGHITVSGKRVTILGGYVGGTYPGTGDFSDANRNPATNPAFVDRGGAATQVTCQDAAAQGSALDGLTIRDGGAILRGGVVLRHLIATSD